MGNGALKIARKRREQKDLAKAYPWVVRISWQVWPTKEIEAMESWIKQNLGNYKRTWGYGFRFASQEDATAVAMAWAEYVWNEKGW